MRVSLRVSTDFPTGNGLIAHDPGGGLLLDIDIRDSDGDRWYWHVRFRTDSPSTARVRMARPGLLGGFGPWIYGHGREGWLAPRPAPDCSFDLALGSGNNVGACATIPYGPKQLSAFVRRTWSRGRPDNGLRWVELTRSEDGRRVPLALGGDTGRPRWIILLTARHHACEAVASYVLEGAADELLRLRREGVGPAVAAELVAVPVIDVDGMWRGDQGKARRPWDHNRDYDALSRYRAVRALRSLVESTDTPLFALDLHTPGLRGEIEERPYVVASACDDDVQHARALLQAAAATGANLLIFDEEWNNPTSTGQRCCAAWLRSLDRTRLALTIEYPNAVDRYRPVTPESARRFGSVLIQALMGTFVRLGMR